MRVVDHNPFTTTRWRRKQRVLARQIEKVHARVLYVLERILFVFDSRKRRSASAKPGFCMEWNGPIVERMTEWKPKHAEFKNAATFRFREGRGVVGAFVAARDRVVTRAVVPALTSLSRE